MTWGRDTDEHEARDQLLAFIEAGGTLLDTAAGYGDGASEELLGVAVGDVSAATRSCSPPRPASAPHRGARYDASRGALLPSLDRSLRRLGVDHVDLWQVHAWVDATPLDETLTRAGLRGEQRAGRRTSASPTTPAGRPRRPPPGSEPCPAGLRSPARRWSTPCSTAGSSRRCCRPRRTGARRAPLVALGRGVLTGKYRSGIPADSRAAGRSLANFVEAYLDDRAGRVVEAVARAADGPAAGRRWRSPWSGCATDPASPRRSSGPAPPPSCAAPWTPRTDAAGGAVQALDDVSDDG